MQVLNVLDSNFETGQRFAHNIKKQQFSKHNHQDFISDKTDWTSMFSPASNSKVHPEMVDDPYADDGGTGYQADRSGWGSVAKPGMWRHASAENKFNFLTRGKRIEFVTYGTYCGCVSRAKIFKEE